MATEPGARSRVLRAVAVLAAVAASAVVVITDGDVPWLVRTGQEILRRRALPTEELFAYTGHGRPLHHEYLTEVLAALAYDGAGVAGLTAWQCLLLAGVAFAVSLAPDAEGRTRPFAGWSPVAVAAAAMLLRETLSVRAQCASNILTALTFVAVLRDQQGDRRALPLALPLGLLWAQLHGGNPHHTALFGVGFLAAPSARRFAFTAAAAALTCVGPYGLRVHAHYLQGTGALHLIKEWQPLGRVLASGNAHAIACVAFAAAACAALVVRWRAGDRSRVELVALALYAALAFRYARTVSELTVLSGVVLARSLAPFEAPRWAPRRALSPLVAAGVVALAVALSPRELGVGFGGRCPLGAVAWLRAHRPPGPMFNSYNLGGWLMLLYPEERVFLDGRGPTAYPERLMVELLAVYRAPARFESLTERHGFRLAVIQPEGNGAPLVAWLRRHPRWRLRHEDARALVFTRE